MRGGTQEELLAFTPEQHEARMLHDVKAVLRCVKPLGLILGHENEAAYAIIDEWNVVDTARTVQELNRIELMCSQFKLVLSYQFANKCVKEGMTAKDVTDILDKDGVLP